MFYLLIIILAIAFLANVFVSSFFLYEAFRTRFFKIAPNITSHKLIQKYVGRYIFNCIHPGKRFRILDIGSGNGSMIFYLNKKLLDCDFVGCEINRFNYLTSKIRNRHKNIQFINCDAKDLTDFNFDFVYVFLFESQNKELLPIYEKFKPGTTIISNTFKIPLNDNSKLKLVHEEKINVINRHIYVYQVQ